MLYGFDMQAGLAQVRNLTKSLNFPINSPPKISLNYSKATRVSTLATSVQAKLAQGRVSLLKRPFPQLAFDWFPFSHWIAMRWSKSCQLIMAETFLCALKNEGLSLVPGTSKTTDDDDDPKYWFFFLEPLTHWISNILWVGRRLINLPTTFRLSIFDVFFLVYTTNNQSHKSRFRPFCSVDDVAAVFFRLGDMKQYESNLN